MRLWPVWFALLGLLADRIPSALAQGEFRGEISRGTLYKTAVEVNDWDYIETPRRLLASGDECERVLVQDLILSDFFEVRRERFSLPGSESTEPGRPAQATASGVVRRRLGKVQLEGRLTDPTTGKLIFRKTYNLDDPPERYAVHAFSDDIVLYLTGERGVASTRIAFVGNATGAKEIYLVDPDGSRVQMLTDLKSICVSPSWSPKADRLAFTTFSHSGPDLVGLTLADGKYWTLSSRPGMNSAPCWHPDGEHLAASLSFEGNSEIYLLDASGRNPRRLTQDPGIDTAPSFNPEGSLIAFTSDRSDQPQIYVMDADGGNVRRLTYVGQHSDSPNWSPKGDRIVFVSLIDRVFDICTIRPDGGDLRRLTGDGGNHENPRWAPDGRHIVFAMSQDKSRRLYIMAADGSGKRQLTWSQGDQYNPSWSPPLGSSGD